MNISLNNNQNKNENSRGVFGLSTQNKLIIVGSFLSSALVVITAWIIIENTQKNILESYNNFGLMLAKTLAVDAYFRSFCSKHF